MKQSFSAEKSVPVKGKKQKNKNKKKNNQQSKNKSNKELNNHKNEEEETLQEEPKVTSKEADNSSVINKTQNNLPIDEINFDNVTILKPSSEPDTVVLSKRNKKKMKEQRKVALQANNTLIPDLTLSYTESQSEYAAKIRKLKAQKEAMEGGVYVPSYDVRKPYYTPDLLYANPETLEKLFHEKTNPISDFQIALNPKFEVSEGTVKNMLSFMHDFIASEGPIHVNDGRLNNHMEEYFQGDCLEYIKHCGGLVKFLLRSVDFALVDDMVCVREDVLLAQKQNAANTAEIFANNAKYHPL